jgi:large subunit ribosomal protein L5
MADEKDKKKKEKGGKPEGGGEKAAAAQGEKKQAKPPIDEAEVAKKRAERAAKKEGKGKAASTAAREGEAGPTGEPPPPARLRVLFDKEIGPALMKELGLTNRMELPRLRKITINMGLGEAISNPKIMDTAVEELRAIAGQQPVVTKAKKSIATFKLREGQKIGCMVTLRRDRMYEFFDRLVTLALPRVRDFKGVSPKAFDGRGNYSLGIREQIIFPEINFDRVDKIKGLNVSIVTSARTDDHGRALLKSLGMPFRS